MERRWGGGGGNCPGKRPGQPRPPPARCQAFICAMSWWQRVPGYDVMRTPHLCDLPPSPKPTAQSNHEKNARSALTEGQCTKHRTVIPQHWQGHQTQASPRSCPRPEGLGDTGTQCNTAGILDAILKRERVLEPRVTSEGAVDLINSSVSGLQGTASKMWVSTETLARGVRGLSAPRIH